jgi:hypothetical protein
MVFPSGDRSSDSQVASDVVKVSESLGEERQRLVLDRIGGRLVVLRPSLRERRIGHEQDDGEQAQAGGTQVWTWHLSKGKAPIIRPVAPRAVNVE